MVSFWFTGTLRMI